jgi:Tfp pilus assembly protein PilZ
VRRRGGRDEVLPVEDLSATGLFVGCDEPFTVGTALDLRLDLPWGERLDLAGRVVRVGPGASGHSGMGIMFVGLDPRAGVSLARYVAARLATLQAG